MSSPTLAARLVTRSTQTPSPVTATAARAVSTPKPTSRELHLLNRFGAGYTPDALHRLRKAGGYYAWFDKQLTPGKVAESTTAKALPGWFPALGWSIHTKDAKNQSGAYMAWEHARDLGNLSMLRRMYSHREVLEQMVDFWSNHFHIPAGYDLAWIQRKPYDAMLRKYALTDFETLLKKATLHPAMQLYLDNWTSVRGAPNENHGREILECHTVGRDAGYSEDMVKDSARILSGYTVNTDTWGGYYDPNRHTKGAVQVLGFKRANSAGDGRDVTAAYLHYLAHHPATAHRIAHKLAVRFVSDKPSKALVAKLARTYLDHGTAIKPVLHVLVHHPEFWASKDKLVRTPYDDLIAACRSLDARAKKPTTDESFANALNWVHGAVLVYQWPKPDGAPEDAQSWTSVSRMLNSFSMHTNFGGGWWPSKGVAWRKPASWLPRKQIRLGAFVEHLSRTWLGRSASDATVKAVCQSLGWKADEVVDADHQVITWQFPRLVAVLLDSPSFMSR
jgi:Protein of unknown function (DUF1800)